MIRPHEDRVDYGASLRPPEGYELGHALATSFSVELEALLMLPVALAFDSTLDGNPQAVTLASLEAVSRLKGRLKVFFQQGNLKAPCQYNRLMALLEPCLAPVLPEHPFSSFHPKIWLLRFIGLSEELPVRYRLLVLTRNLTFSRNWDLAVSIEGLLGEESQQGSDELCDFIDCLKPWASDFEGFNFFNRELPRITWSAPPPFRRMRMLPGNHDRVPLDMGRGTDTILVMSPFLHAEALAMLRSHCEGEAFLFSSAHELNRLGEATLQDWQCFALSDQVVSGEDSLDQAVPQDLHAKLIVLKNGGRYHWHVGSANATAAALGTLTDYPRNTEFMLRLTGNHESCAPASLLRELVGEEGRETRVFVPHVFSVAPEDEEPLDAQIRRELVHRLICSAWAVEAGQQPDDLYHCRVMAPTGITVPEGFHIEVGQLAIPHDFRPITGKLTWDNMSGMQVSAFVPVRVIRESDEEPVIRLLIQAVLTMKGGDRREAAILSDLVNTEKKFMSYIQMLLHSDRQQNEHLDLGRGEGLDGSGDGWSRTLEGPVLEMLLNSAARHPEHLRRIRLLMERLEKTEVPVPKDFLKVWKHFAKRVGKQP